jgi:hypothetical protein
MPIYWTNKGGKDGYGKNHDGQRAEPILKAE